MKKTKELKNSRTVKYRLETSRFSKKSIAKITSESSRIFEKNPPNLKIIAVVKLPQKRGILVNRPLTEVKAETDPTPFNITVFMTSATLTEIKYKNKNKVVSLNISPFLAKIANKIKRTTTPLKY
jgi:hypothetical protein